MNKNINFKAVLDAFRRDADRHETLEQYEQTIEPLEGIEDIRETAFYKKHLALFHIPQNISMLRDDSEHIIDQDLLLRLICASFSSQWNLDVDEAWLKCPTPEIKLKLDITVSYDGQTATRTLDDLNIEQIKRMFLIYIQEQMNYTILREEDPECDEELSEMLEEKAAAFGSWMKALESQAQVHLID